MFQKAKVWLKDKAAKIGIAATLASAAVMTCAGAAAESPSGAMDIINEATTSLRSDAVTVIAAGLGIGVLFFGAKFLWSKFKGMTK
ncbi:hypothetical protein [Agathobaculum sp.]|uniref:hypothetical protein n=1 Tax=Agathobaculum sp. TaxID=2048138 RepID=UPI002A82CAF3|nr:hypothetical protein [Agathobaculum sp.]MDY3618092.1 hypothetical protein [Agathobaculum sp.]